MFMEMVDIMMVESLTTHETADTYTQAEKDDIGNSSADVIESESTDGTASIDEVKTRSQLRMLFRLLIAGQTSVTHAFVDSLNELWRNDMITDEERAYILRHPFLVTCNYINLPRVVIIYTDESIQYHLVISDSSLSPILNLLHM